MNRFADVFRPFLEGNVARELLEAPIHHIDAKREKRQITVELHPERDFEGGAADQKGGRSCTI